MTLTNENEKEITQDEAQLYDRQIRLWGLNAQKSLRKANILLIGLCGSGSEIAKNLILSGIHSIVIVENKEVTHADVCSNLFTTNQFGTNRARASEQNLKNLNPMVQIEIKEWDIIDKLNKDDVELINLLKNVNVVCINNYDSITISKLNNLIRTIKGTNDTKFYATANWGYYAFSFTDLGTNYKYLIEEAEKTDQIDIGSSESSRKRIKTEDTREKKKLMVEKILDFVSFDQMMDSKGNKPGSGITKRTNATFLLVHVMFEFFKKNQRYPELRTQEQDQQELANLANELIDKLHLDKKLLDKLNDQDCWANVYGDLSVITAILGGVVGQEIIRSITVQDNPIRNVFLFNGFQCSGSIENIRG